MRLGRFLRSVRTAGLIIAILGDLLGKVGRMISPPNLGDEEVQDNRIQQDLSQDPLTDEVENEKPEEIQEDLFLREDDTTVSPHSGRSP